MLLHAVCDALLGAIGCQDIGEHFPDTDPKYKDISSRELLKNTALLVKRKGFKIGNIDCIIILEEPKLSAYKLKMRKQISSLLKIKEEAVNIKAKTNERLGDVGKSKAIASYSVVNIIRE